jgi:hypothetical protein
MIEPLVRICGAVALAPNATSPEALAVLSVHGNEHYSISVSAVLPAE